jgi:dTDP-4-amino-4,6-dideoxygalactose transaminase
MNVPFYKPYLTGNELKYMQDILDQGTDLAGDGVYTKKVHAWFEKRYGVAKVLLTTSGTTALELAVRLLNLKKGDDVIVPSFTFSSTVNAILLAEGVKAIFVDIEPNTLNIDVDKIEEAITSRTKAIMVVHYAGVSCDMDKLMNLAKKHNLQVVEDAAQAIESKYKGKYLGTFGDFGCLSFHGTKNVTSGEGGALFINKADPTVIEQAEIIREKGTNRTKFLQGLVDKYTWVDLGGSYLPSDLLAAFLYAQLENIDVITSMRKERHAYYESQLRPLTHKGFFTIPQTPDDQDFNAHIFYIVLPDESTRNRVMKEIRAKGVSAAFHYIPLHSSPQGQKMGNDPDSLPVTKEMSGRMLRLPLFSQITPEEQDYVIATLKDALDLNNKI